MAADPVKQLGRHDETDVILAQVRRGSAAVRSTSRAGRRGFYERARQRRGGLTMSLNLTPMIDTVFNLLFFFMIVSRFGAIEGLLPGKLPVRESTSAARAAPGIPRMPIRIRLVPEESRPDACRYTIDGLVSTAAALSDLPARLDSIRQNEPGFGQDTPVHLLAGDGVAWDHVVNAYNAALSAGYDKIYFAGAP